MPKEQKSHGGFYGRHHSQLARKKMRENHWDCSGSNHPMFGKHHSPLARKKMHENHVDFSGKNNPMFGCKGKDAPMFGKHHSSEALKKIGEGNQGKSRSSKTRKKISRFQKELWKNPEHAKKVFAHRSPNSKELECFDIIDSVAPKDFKFVGNGEFVLGGKCPDFMNVNGKKLLIEFNSEYWHKGENTRTRYRHFAKYGHRTLFIWQRELKNPERLKKKILKFVG
jgi:hypothetical protein